MTIKSFFSYAAISFISQVKNLFELLKLLFCDTLLGIPLSLSVKEQPDGGVFVHPKLSGKKTNSLQLETPSSFKLWIVVLTCKLTPASPAGMGKSEIVEFKAIFTFEVKYNSLLNARANKLNTTFLFPPSSTGLKFIKNTRPSLLLLLNEIKGRYFFSSSLIG